MFECRRCGKKFEIEGYSEDGTFYTLCEECSEEVLKEWEGKRKNDKGKREGEKDA